MEDKDVDFEVPVVIDRREFFDQEAMFADDGDEVIQPYLEPADPEDELKKMREAAKRKTAEP